MKKNDYQALRRTNKVLRSLFSLHLSDTESRSTGLVSEMSLTLLTLPSSCRSG